MGSDCNSLFDKALSKGLSTLRIDTPEAQRAVLRGHFQCVVEANRRFNLTRITAPAAFAIKHHADSLAVAKWAHEIGLRIRRVLDIGTGAGLPAVPLAIARPEWHVTAIDGTAKKATFVARLADQLGIANLQSVHARAESWHCDSPFDLAVLKAVGPLERCLRFANTHLSPGGRVVIYKTANLPAAEISQAVAVAQKLGFAQPKIYRYELPLESETLARTLWIYRLARRQAAGFSRRRRRHGRGD